MVPEPSKELSTGMVVVAETNAAALSENALRARPQTTNTNRPPCVERLRRTLTKITARMATSAIGNAARKYEANEDSGNKYACGRDSAPLMKARESTTMTASSAARLPVANWLAAAGSASSPAIASGIATMNAMSAVDGNGTGTPRATE